jgi:N6-adenosine-specific RNA methylase IME4
MKVRSGFISNSSSSSFIVAVDGNDSTITITTKVDLKDMTESICRTVDELTEYFMETYSYGRHNSIEKFLNDPEDRWFAEQYMTAKKAIEDGKTVLIGSFDSCGSPVESMLCDSGLNGMVDENIKVIHSEGGY